MLSFHITIDVFLLPASVIVSAGIGAIIRNRQLTAAQKKITALEKEMLRAHAAILELQKKGAAAKRAPREAEAPVPV